MKRLLIWFDGLPIDKKDHFISALFISSVLVFIFGWKAALLVIGYAFVKETVFDTIVKLRHPSMWDFAASAIGALIPMLAALREVIF